ARQADLARSVCDAGCQRADRLIVTHANHFSASDNFLANADRLEEFPLDAEEDRTWSGQILGHEGVEKARSHAALDDQSTEHRTRRQLLIVVKRIPIAGHVTERDDVTRPGDAPALCAGAYLRLAESGSGPSGSCDRLVHDLAP